MTPVFQPATRAAWQVGVTDGRFRENSGLQLGTRIGAWNRSGVSAERRLLARVGMAALYRAAATPRCRESGGFSAALPSQVAGDVRRRIG